MRLVVTGGSSFVGAWFCHAAKEEHEVLAVYRNTPVNLEGVQGVRLDLASPEAGQRLAELKPEAIVHTACKVKGTGKGLCETPASRMNRQMMDAVLAVGSPVIYASSTCVHWEQASGYAQGRREDEQRLREASIPWAVLRPSAPYGPRLPRHRPSHRESFHTLAALIRRSPIVPIIGHGHYLRQPVHVHDLSQSMLALLRGGLPQQAFDAGGVQALSFREIVAVCARHLGVRRRVLPVPKRVLARVLSMSSDFEPDLLETADTDDVADPSALALFTGHQPRSFSDGVADLFR